MKNTLTRFWKARKNTHTEPYPRKPLDTMLEYLRFRKVEPYIPKDARLLDVGTGDGNFLNYLDGHIKSAVGIDPHLTKSMNTRTGRIVSGTFPHDFESDTLFDVITMMAVIEHIPVNAQHEVAKACWKYLKPGGQIIITVPHPRADKILDMLKRLRIVNGFAMHEHYGFDPECLPDIFNRWTLRKRKR